MKRSIKESIAIFVSVAMIALTVGVFPAVASADVTATYVLTADGISYTPEEAADGTGDYYVELLNSERTQTPVLTVTPSGSSAVVSAKVDGAAATVTDNSVSLSDYELHDVEVTVTSGGSSATTVIHIYPTVYMVQGTKESGGDVYDHGGTITATGGSKSYATVVTSDDIYTKLGYVQRYQYATITSVTYYPTLESAGRYKVYAWQTYNTSNAIVYPSAAATVTHNGTTAANKQFAWYSDPAGWVEIGEYYFNASGDQSENIVLTINNSTAPLDSGNGSDAKRSSSIKLVKVDDGDIISVTGKSIDKEIDFSLESDSTAGKSYSLYLTDPEGASITIAPYDGGELTVNGSAAERLSPLARI